MDTSFDTDVFVVGGGPAGLAAAIAARQAGLRAMVADLAQPPIDKACGEGLMPDSVAALEELGVSLRGQDVGRIRGIRFVGPRECVEAEFGSGKGFGVRRTLLHSLLVERAREAGVEMLWGARVEGVRDDGEVMNVFVSFRRNPSRTDARRACARWVIGADGANSRVREWAGLDRGGEYERRLGLRQHFGMEPWSDFVEVHWADSCQAYVTPVGEREIGVAFLMRQRPESLDAALRLFPELAARLEGAPRTSEVKGAPTVSRRMKKVTRGDHRSKPKPGFHPNAPKPALGTPGIALIGDASGSADAITGEGLGIAFRQALALGKALAREDLAAYEAEHWRISALPHLMGRSMLMMDRSARLRARTLRALAEKPALFQRLLAVHVRELSLGSFGVSGLVEVALALSF